MNAHTHYVERDRQDELKRSVREINRRFPMLNTLMMSGNFPRRGEFMGETYPVAFRHSEDCFAIMTPLGKHDQAPTDPSTPETPQPTDPTEGGSVGPSFGTPGGEPQKNPDPGIEQHPHRPPAVIPTGADDA